VDILFVFGLLGLCAGLGMCSIVYNVSKKNAAHKKV